MKVVKILHSFVKLHRVVFTKISLCLQINGRQNTTFQFSVELISNKMHEVNEGVIELILNFVFIRLRLYSKFERTLLV